MAPTRGLGYDDPLPMIELEAEDSATTGAQLMDRSESKTDRLRGQKTSPAPPDST